MAKWQRDPPSYERKGGGAGAMFSKSIGLKLAQNMWLLIFDILRL
jgi:hypothetical protein